MKNVKEFLDLCHRRFPSPRPDQYHTLTLRDGVVVLTLLLGDSYQMFNLAEEDLKKPPALLLQDVVTLFKNPGSVPIGPTLA